MIGAPDSLVDLHADVGVATTLDRNAARATRLEVDVAAQAGVAVDYIPKVTDKASDYANNPSSIPVEDVVDTVQPIVEKVISNFDEDDVPSWVDPCVEIELWRVRRRPTCWLISTQVDPIIKTVNGIVGWINGLLGGGGGGGSDDMDDDETNAKVLCPGSDAQCIKIKLSRRVVRFSDTLSAQMIPALSRSIATVRAIARTCVEINQCVGCTILH